MALSTATASSASRTFSAVSSSSGLASKRVPQASAREGSVPGGAGGIVA
jgi:hypothetical protein